MVKARAGENVRGNRCGWVRGSRHYGEAAQIETLKAHKVHPIYTASEHTVADMVRTLLDGDQVWVTTLGRLATTRRELGPALRAIEAKGAYIVEAATGRHSNKRDDVRDMVLDAADEIARDARALPRKLAQKFGALGGKASAKKRAAENGRMPKAEARGFWKDTSITNEEALERMTGWTAGSAYRHLGKSGRPAGRNRGNVES